MIENENTSVEMGETADQQDAFLEGWGDDDSPEEMADQPMEREEQEEQSDDSAEEETENEPSTADENTGDPAAETTDSGATETPNQPEQQDTAAVTWTVKHMDQTRTISAKEITPELLQKGLDYDRIRGKYDEAKPVMEMFGRFAAQAGMSTSDYVKFIRAEAKKASGMSEAEARKAVELEDREAAVSAKEAQQRATVDKKEAVNARVQADLADFQKAFPQVYAQAKNDRTVIPVSVWDAVNAGMSLSAAYARYAVAEAERAVREANQRAESAGNNQRNAKRAAGSMKSAGSGDNVKDAFLEGWDS